MSTVTRSAEETAAKDAEIAAATAAAASMYDQVRDLSTDGYISDTGGRYHALSDFNETWAQIYWYQWWYTKFSPPDFVLRTDVTMDSAAAYADSASGCAIVFREDGTENHYLAVVDMYGGVSLSRVYKGRMANIGWDTYGSINVRTDRLQFMLAVQGDKISAFVDGEHVLTRIDTVLTSGNLALSLLSGTNKDFGTKCQMKNIELWILD